MESRSLARSRRGVSLPEVLISASISTALVSGLIAFSRFQQLTWLDGVASTSSQSAAQMAMQRITPDIRCARQVVSGLSNTSRLTLQMPLFAANGSLVVPLLDGDVVSYYLSDSTGSTQATGGILWRSVNGVPDAKWALQGKAGRISLGAGGLGFTYLPAVDPRSITVRVNATATAGSRSRTLAASQEVLLRNHGL